jgi:ABC-type branched-subunit amino acid transport system substrate-binding protein
VYEAAGLVTASGSATAGDLPSLGPTVFNRTTVSDPDGAAAWYAAVQELPSDRAFAEDHEAEFDAVPTDYTDLSYDAASLLLRRIRQVSLVDGQGNLGVDRERLARTVRSARWFRGVSCTVTLDAAGNRMNDPARLAGCADG